MYKAVTTIEASEAIDLQMIYKGDLCLVYPLMLILPK